jgi:hypothetical protein
LFLPIFCFSLSTALAPQVQDVFFLSSMTIIDQGMNRQIGDPDVPAPVFRQV